MAYNGYYSPYFQQTNQQSSNNGQQSYSEQQRDTAAPYYHTNPTSHTDANRNTHQIYSTNQTYSTNAPTYSTSNGQSYPNYRRLDPSTDGLQNTSGYSTQTSRPYVDTSALGSLAYASALGRNSPSVEHAAAVQQASSRGIFTASPAQNVITARVANPSPVYDPNTAKTVVNNSQQSRQSTQSGGVNPIAHGPSWPHATTIAANALVEARRQHSNQAQLPSIPALTQTSHVSSLNNNAIELRNGNVAHQQSEIRHNSSPNLYRNQRSIQQPVQQPVHQSVPPQRRQNSYQNVNPDSRVPTPPQNGAYSSNTLQQTKSTSKQNHIATSDASHTSKQQSNQSSGNRHDSSSASQWPFRRLDQTLLKEAPIHNAGLYSPEAMPPSIADQHPMTVDPSQIFNQSEYQRRKQAAEAEAQAGKDTKQRRLQETQQKFRSDVADAANGKQNTGVTRSSGLNGVLSKHKQALRSPSSDFTDGATNDAKEKQEAEIKASFLSMFGQMRELKAKNPTMFLEIWEDFKKTQPPFSSSSQAPQPVKEAIILTSEVISPVISDNGQPPTPQVNKQLSDLRRLPAQPIERNTNTSEQQSQLSKEAEAGRPTNSVVIMGTNGLNHTPAASKPISHVGHPTTKLSTFFNPRTSNRGPESMREAINGAYNVSQQHFPRQSPSGAPNAPLSIDRHSNSVAASQESVTLSPQILPPQSSSGVEWPENIRTRLAMTIWKELFSEPMNLAKRITVDKINQEILKLGPTFNQLCGMLEAKGFVINRKKLSQSLLETMHSNITVYQEPVRSLDNKEAAQISNASSRPTQKSSSKAEMARKRSFNEIVDLTQELDSADISGQKKQPRIEELRNGEWSLTDETSPLHPPESPANAESTRSTNLSQYRAPAASMSEREDLRLKLIVHPLDRAKALRRNSYDAKTLARDILISTGRHPTKRSLNWHLDSLRDTFRHVTQTSDLSTLRWDLIDPGGPTQIPAEAHDADDEAEDLQTEGHSQIFVRRPQPVPFTTTDGDVHVMSSRRTGMGLSELLGNKESRSIGKDNSIRSRGRSRGRPRGRPPGRPSLPRGIFRELRPNVNQTDLNVGTPLRQFGTSPGLFIASRGRGGGFGRGILERGRDNSRLTYNYTDGTISGQRLPPDSSMKANGSVPVTQVGVLGSNAAANNTPNQQRTAANNAPSQQRQPVTSVSTQQRQPPTSTPTQQSQSTFSATIQQRQPTVSATNSTFIDLSQMDAGSALSEIHQDIHQNDNENRPSSTIQVRMPIINHPTGTPERRRGRPPGSVNKQKTPKDFDDSDKPKRRGRPPGSFKSTTPGSSQLRGIRSSEGIAVMVPSRSPSMNLSIPSSRKRAGYSHDSVKKMKSREEAEQPSSPSYRVYKCCWKGCTAELHNLDTLRRHVFKLHCKKGQSEEFPCLWFSCGHKRQSSIDMDETETWQLDAFEFATKDAWKNHVEKQHLVPLAWQLGDGPSVHPSDAEMSDYLSDAQGRQITPLITAEEQRDLHGEDEDEDEDESENEDEGQVEVVHDNIQVQVDDRREKENDSEGEEETETETEDDTPPRLEPMVLIRK